MALTIAITGATGNVGTAAIRALTADPQVGSIVGIARRRPRWQPDHVTWVQADVARDDLRPYFAGADVVLHLAWLIQPSRSEAITRAVNVDGSRRVFEAAVDVGVPAIVHASSLAAYSPGDPNVPVDESWPVHGIPGSYYSQQKVEVEGILDSIGAIHPELRVARARPALIFQRSAASELRRYFGGPLVPGRLARRSLIPFVPQIAGLVGQVVHADDVGDLYRRLCTDPSASGAYNVASWPSLDAQTLGHLLGAPPVHIPRRAARLFVEATWRARLQPVSPDWLDLGRLAPIMLTDRARDELGWQPEHEAEQVVLELMAGLRENAGFDTPPLAPHAGGPLRLREFLSGVGGPNRLDRQSAGV